MTTSYETVLGSSNFYRAEWNAFMDETEEYTDEYQIFNPFHISAISPSGNYTLSSLPTLLSISFSNTATIGTGTLTVYNSLDVAVATFNQLDITDAGTSFTIDITGLITTNDTFYIQFTYGLFLSLFGQSVAIENETDWTFTTAAGEFDNTEFDTDFLLN